MIRYILPIIAFILFLFTACDSNRVYEEYKEIPDLSWHVEEAVEFNVNVDDTLTPHNIYINIRHSGSYPFANLYMFIDLEYPSGEEERDTVQVLLADKTGRWLGDGLGDLWDAKVLFKRGVQFPETGKYTFRMWQAQRYGRTPYLEELPFIVDMGLRVEKQEQ